MRRSDLDPRRVRRIVAIYLCAAVLWIFGSAAFVGNVASQFDISTVTLELVKGLGFVLVTAAVLHRSLLRWARRLQAAAGAEQLAAERLRHVEEMRTAFLSGISHELRTPLTALVGYSETIERRAERLTDEQLARISARLVANATRLDRLVIDLLEVDRLVQGLGHLRVEPTDILELAERVATSCDAAERSLTVVGQPASAFVDKAKLERLLEHLIDNALRHTPPGTAVTVTIDADEEAVRMRVEDDGDGLPGEILGTLFDPFVQDASAAQRPSPGMGIGLTLVAKYAALHGGIAEAENRPGGGARFTIAIPRASQTERASVSSPWPVVSGV